MKNSRSNAGFSGNRSDACAVNRLVSAVLDGLYSVRNIDGGQHVLVLSLMVSTRRIKERRIYAENGKEIAVFLFGKIIWNAFSPNIDGPWRC